MVGLGRTAWFGEFADVEKLQYVQIDHQKHNLDKTDFGFSRICAGISKNSLIRTHTAAFVGEAQKPSSVITFLQNVFSAIRICPGTPVALSFLGVAGATKAGDSEIRQLPQSRYFAVVKTVTQARIRVI